MNIVIIGTGYVGLVSGTCFAEFGFSVTCCDKRQDIIHGLKNGSVPIFEPGLDSLIAKNIKAGRLHFTNDVASSVATADIVFIAVGTPTNELDGSADLSYVMKASEEIAQNLQGYTVIVTKSTVPVDTNKKIAALITKTSPNAEFDVVSNPEFLREGSAIADFMQPDRVVVGTILPRARALMEKLYAPLANQNIPIIYTTPVSAELIKYASNCFLATKITFINEMSDLCEKTGADIKEVSRAVGLDHRIGTAFLNPGPGYGGSCFPKDTRALAETARAAGAPLNIVDTVIRVNENRKMMIAQKIVHHLGNPAGKKIAFLGITFKADTDDIRESASLTIIPYLQAQGITVAAYDPEGMKHGHTALPNVEWAKTPYDTMVGADAVVIMTEWNEFKSLKIDTLKQHLKTPLIIDFRNLYSPHDMQEKGVRYVSLGQKTLVEKT